MKYKFLCAFLSFLLPLILISQKAQAQSTFDYFTIDPFITFAHPNPLLGSPVGFNDNADFLSEDTGTIFVRNLKNFDTTNYKLPPYGDGFVSGVRIALFNNSKHAALAYARGDGGAGYRYFFYTPESTIELKTGSSAGDLCRIVLKDISKSDILTGFEDCFSDPLGLSREARRAVVYFSPEEEPTYFDDLVEIFGVTSNNQYGAVWKENGDYQVGLIEFAKDSNQKYYVASKVSFTEKINEILLKLNGKKGIFSIVGLNKNGTLLIQWNDSEPLFQFQAAPRGFVASKNSVYLLKDINSPLPITSPLRINDQGTVLAESTGERGSYIILKKNEDYQKIHSLYSLIQQIPSRRSPSYTLPSSPRIKPILNNNNEMFLHSLNNNGDNIFLFLRPRSGLSSRVTRPIDTGSTPNIEPNKSNSRFFKTNVKLTVGKKSTLIFTSNKHKKLNECTLLLNFSKSKEDALEHNYFKSFKVQQRQNTAKIITQINTEIANEVYFSVNPYCLEFSTGSENQPKTVKKLNLKISNEAKQTAEILVEQIEAVLSAL